MKKVHLLGWTMISLLALGCAVDDGNPNPQEQLAGEESLEKADDALCGQTGGLGTKGSPMLWRHGEGFFKKTAATTWAECKNGKHIWSFTETGAMHDPTGEPWISLHDPSRDMYISLGPDKAQWRMGASDPLKVLYFGKWDYASTDPTVNPPRTWRHAAGYFRNEDAGWWVEFQNGTPHAKFKRIEITIGYTDDKPDLAKYKVELRDEKRNLHVLLTATAAFFRMGPSGAWSSLYTGRWE